MHKTILITGSTDGIGLATARLLAAQGHAVLLHGRQSAKLADVAKTVSSLPGAGTVETFQADLSRRAEVETLARDVTERHPHLDVLINNAGVFRTPRALSPDGLDMRFAVNTIAPCLLTQRLLPLLGAGGRVVNLSSAAQAPVDPGRLTGPPQLDAMAAYAQSKLALSLGSDGPVVVAVNPGSLLGSKMVKEAFGVDGGDLRIGAEILVRAAVGGDFASASGLYFDNDTGRFAAPHPDALDARKSQAVVAEIEGWLAQNGS